MMDELINGAYLGFSPERSDGTILFLSFGKTNEFAMTPPPEKRRDAGRQRLDGSVTKYFIVEMSG
jgi:hypothetical protein